MKTYSEKLRDPRWQKKRLEVFQRDCFACQSCDDRKSNLQVHHCYHLPKLEPWDYPDESLITLCEDCHNEQTMRIPRLMMQNKTPEQTMNNTEVLENVNYSEMTLGVASEIAYGLRLRAEGDIPGYRNVIAGMIERLQELMEEVDHP